MAAPHPQNLALVLCLALQVTVAPWLPCPCRWVEGDTQRASAPQREAADQGDSQCGLCQAGNNARQCRHLPPPTRHADVYAATAQTTRLPVDRAAACGVALVHCSPPLTPDGHELQVLLE